MMTKYLAVWMMLAMLMAGGPGIVAAQAYEEGQPQRCAQMNPPEPSIGQSPGMRCGMMGSGMGRMGCPMMGPMVGTMPGMRRMPGGMMGSPENDMMEMMGAGTTDPKMMGRMLQMRGEMLKAIGEILLKHGRLMEEGK